MYTNTLHIPAVAMEAASTSETFGMLHTSTWLKDPQAE
jgi:hypothetical protein